MLSGHLEASGSINVLEVTRCFSFVSAGFKVPCLPPGLLCVLSIIILLVLTKGQMLTPIMNVM